MRNPQIFRWAWLLAGAGIVVVGAVSALRAQPLDYLRVRVARVVRHHQVAYVGGPADPD
jgi:hypothetical protein